MAALSSMTGFARTEGECDGFGWVWELKSVNGRSLDQRFRLPPGFDALEARLKVRLAGFLKRGSISATLSVSEPPAAAGFRINEAALAQVIRLMRDLEGRVDAAPPRLDGILSLRGVLESEDRSSVGDEAKALRVDSIAAGFEAALMGLAESRLAEGARLGAVLTQRLGEIAALVSEAERAAATQPGAIRARFQQRLTDLLDGQPPVAEERLAQEVALLIQRADVREELDRLHAHIAAARSLVAEGAEIGRRLDFLCQEFNREANTLCSKSAELGLTSLGLALKATIEQFREQVQNIE